MTENTPRSPGESLAKLLVDGVVGLLDITFGAAIREANEAAELKALQIQVRTLELLKKAVENGKRVTRKEVCDSLESDPNLADWEIANKLEIPEAQVRRAIKRWYHIF